MIDIVVYSEEMQTDEHFYSIMGKYFASRFFTKEMGGWQFYNKPNSTWFLAYVGNELVGFCAMFNEKTHIFLDNFLILEQHRGKGLSRTLFDYRLDAARKTGKEIRVITSNPYQIKNYERNGLTLTGNRGKYKKYTLTQV